MDDRLISMAAWALVIVALGVAAFFYVRFRHAARQRDSALGEAARERQQRREAEEREAATSLRIKAVHERYGEILQGTPHKAPSRLWRVKALAWLAGLVTGATAAARTVHAPGGAAAVSVKAGAIGAVALAVAAGGITYAVQTMHDPDERPPVTAAAAPPAVTRQPAPRTPSHAATAPPGTPEAPTATTEASPTTTTPTTTTAPVTTPPRATSTTKAPTTTGAPVAAPPSVAPVVAATPPAPADEATKIPPGHAKDKGRGEDVAITPATTATTLPPVEVKPPGKIKVHPIHHLLCAQLHPLVDLCV